LKTGIKGSTLPIITILALLLAAIPAFAAPIQIGKALFASKADGFGNYTREEDNHFLSGNSTIVYIELDNFTVERSEEDYGIDINVELDVLDSEGRIIAKSNSVFKKDLKSNQRDLSFKIPLDFSKWKKGKYTIALKATDNIRKMLGVKQLPLEIF